jgi:ABC-type bacteriocin/lantibiotic exporter with double-glycine peptidase domain
MMVAKQSAFKLREIFDDKYAVATLLLICIHQSIIASGAYFLTNVIENFQSGKHYERDLLLYFSAMVIPFFPGCLSYITLKKWENRVHFKFLQALKSSLSGRIDIYKNLELREGAVGMISRNSFSIIGSFCSYLHSSITFLLNSVLSIAIIAAILPKQLVVGYVASALFSIVVIYFASPIVSRKAKVAEYSHIKYGDILAKIWPNTSIGNTYNEQKWIAQAELKAASFYWDVEDATVFRQLNNFMLGVAALLPSMYLIYMAATANAVTASVFAAIIVNLTRIIHILNSFGALVYQVLDLKSVAARMHMLRRLILQIEENKSFSPSQPPGVVKVNDAVIEDFQEIAEKLAERKSGRFLVTGDNGAGKSLLLLHLKSHFGTSAVLLPVDMEGIQWQRETSNLSTGQRLIQVLGELVAVRDHKVLLLDEWDANLDGTNKAAVSDKLDAIAGERLVVEVRHTST